MQSFPKNATLVRYAFATFGNIVFKNAKFKGVVQKAGGIKAAIQAMQDHLFNEKVQVGVLAFIRNMVADSEMFRKDVSVKVGVDSLIPLARSSLVSTV